MPKQSIHKYLPYALSTYHEVGIKDKHVVAVARYLCIAKRAVTPAIRRNWKRWLQWINYGGSPYA